MTITRSLTPDIPTGGAGYLRIFDGEAQHLAHHKRLEDMVESIAVTPADVYTLPGVSNTTTTVVQLVAILAAAGLITAV